MIIKRENLYNNKQGKICKQQNSKIKQKFENNEKMKFQNKIEKRKKFFKNTEKEKLVMTKSKNLGI